MENITAEMNNSSVILPSPVSALLENSTLMKNETSLEVIFLRLNKEQNDMPTESKVFSPTFWTQGLSLNIMGHHQKLLGKKKAFK